MDGGERVSSGLRDFLKAFASNLAAILHNRLELFSTEAFEAGHRLIQMLVWTVAALFSGCMAFILINVTIVYLFWEEARLTVLLCLTLFYTLLVAGIAIGFSRYLKHIRPPFSDTINEFKKDYECFRRRG